jgi:hypothetical protein
VNRHDIRLRGDRYLRLIDETAGMFAEHALGPSGE